MIFSVISIILVLTLAYSLVLYVPVLAILSKLFKKSPIQNSDFKPNLTFLIAAYNEEKYIADALRSISELNYDISKIQVLVGSDGSSDRTVEVANSFASKFNDFKVLDLQRGGKNNVLNSLYPHIHNDFVYIIDADFRLTPNSINESVKYFADPNVGAIISKLDILSQDDDENAGVVGEGAYQKIDNYIKLKESEIWTTVNNFGCYGIRRELISQIPNNKVCDDMYNILQVAAHGKRAIITNDSVVNEVREKMSAEEVNRRKRIYSGSISTMFAVKNILNPGIGWGSYFYFSHRFLRFFYPIFLILLIILTPFTYFENLPIFFTLAIGQGLMYLFGLIGYLLEKKNIVIKIFSFPYFFILLNIGYFQGLIQFFQNKQSAIWERVDTK